MDNSNYNDKTIIEYTTRIINKSENPLEPAVLKKYEQDLKLKNIKFNRDDIKASDTLSIRESKLIEGQIDHSTEVVFGSYNEIKSKLSTIVIDENLAMNYRTDKNFIVRDVVINKVLASCPNFQSGPNPSASKKRAGLPDSANLIGDGLVPHLY